MIHRRRHQPALTRGDLQLLPSADPVLAFTRRAPGLTLLFAFNFSAQPVYQTLERWPACIQADELDVQVRRFEQTVGIPGFGVFIGVGLSDAPPSDR